MKKRTASSNKKCVVAIIAVLAALIGGAVAAYAFLKRKAQKLGQQLDYDGNLYYEDEDPLGEDNGIHDFPGDGPEAAGGVTASECDCGCGCGAEGGAFPEEPADDFDGDDLDKPVE